MAVLAQKRGEIPREHHYCPDSGESQFWQFNSLAGWMLLEDKYPDWHHEEYTYYSWDRAIPTAIKNQPPRIWL